LRFGELTQPDSLSALCFLLYHAAMQTRRHETDKDVLIVEASDAINDDATEGMIERIEGEIESGKIRKIIVDCSAVQFLSSFGLSMILRLRNAAVGIDGEVKLSGLAPMIDQMLRISKVAQLFLVYPDAEQARLSFRIRQRSI
jgi:anti-anti-sigma factor